MIDDTWMFKTASRVLVFNGWHVLDRAIKHPDHDIYVTVEDDIYKIYRDSVDSNKRLKEKIFESTDLSDLINDLEKRIGINIITQRYFWAVFVIETENENSYKNTFIETEYCVMFNMDEEESRENRLHRYTDDGCVTLLKYKELSESDFKDMSKGTYF